MSLSQEIYDFGHICQMPFSRDSGGIPAGAAFWKEDFHRKLRTVYFLVMLHKGHRAKIKDKEQLFKLYEEGTPAIETSYNPIHFDGLGQEIRVEDGCR